MPNNAAGPRELRSITLPEFLHGVGGADPKRPFDVVVVGSGYGGSVAVHTLSRATLKDGGKPRVLLLERGRPFKPGDFPSTFAEMPRELRVAQQTTGQVSGHEGLFDLRLGDDVAVLVANGLGGGSLINAGVMLDPDPKDVREALGQTTLSDHLRTLLALGDFKRARRMLGGEVWRNEHWVSNNVGRLAEPLRKTTAYRAIAIEREVKADPVDITVAFDNGPNYAGVELKACIQCGDCMTGCTAGAKDSLDRNLLLAAQEGLDNNLVIVTGATVTSLQRVMPEGQPVAWELRVVHTDARLQERETSTFKVLADRVVLAAGALGSPEVLLRTRSDKLVFSEALGESFSGNGDDIAAVHRLKEPVFSLADEDIDRDQRRVGPTTTSRVLMKQDRDRPFLLEEFSVPGPMKRLFEEIVTTGYTISQLPKLDGSPHHEADLDPLAVDQDAMQRTLLLGVIGHDDAGGSLRLALPTRPPDRGVPQMGAIRIHWPQARWGREFDATHERLRAFAEKLPSNRGPKTEEKPPTLVSNPMWRLLPQGLDDLVSQPRGPLLTVHPLGGCRMGRNAKLGVVDTCGRVFNAGDAAVDDWFGSLVVLDGSIIGASLGVNPSLTITALALHAMQALCDSWGMTPPLPDSRTDPKLKTRCAEKEKAAPLPDVRPPAPPPERTTLRIAERLWGRLRLKGHGECVAELTLGFQAMAVATLIGKERVPLRALPERSVLRIYDAAQWHEKHLEGASDAERTTFVRFEAALSGSLRFLHREETRAWPRTLRALWHWRGNRGLRDTYQRLEPLLSAAGRSHRRALKAARPQPAGSHSAQSWFGRVFKAWGDLCSLASHNGQGRLFDYDLRIHAVQFGAEDFGKLLSAGSVIKGRKRLGYGRRSSPWTQLTEMQLRAMPGLEGQPAPFKLDSRFLAGRGVPLIEVASQRNHAEAMAELLSFGLYMLRVLLDTHLWSFRKPDRAGPALPSARTRREPDRLPGDLPGVPAPKITSLVVDRWPRGSPFEGQPVTIRLTHYAQPPHGPSGKPLVMIHGYSASGTTFAHPTLKPSAAQHFWKQGRDVWVLDLRTSCGLPSATWPWSMEQIGAVDIPAALLHVRNSTGQKVDVLAHCIGGAMLGMALLTDSREVRNGSQELGPETWLTSEHLGVLSAFNGDAPAGGPHPVINRIVLSQKGPVMRYTDENLLRAFVLQYVRRWLLPNGWQFRPSSNPGVAEELMDRLLSSLPYPAADFDVENPGWPCARTAWVATRHRLDALFGRTFSANNLLPDTLEAIDDFFGPINLDTVAQTIHFARLDVITNQRGRGEFVTRERLKKRWGCIPTLALHGADNGLTHPYTLQLLAKTLGDVGVPLTTHPLPDTGHQDTLIGRNSAAVFGRVEAFLSGHVAPNHTPTTAGPWMISSPWIGPRLVAPFDGAGNSRQPRVAVMSATNQGDATLWLVPVLRREGAHGEPQHFELLADAPAGWVQGDSGDSRFWLFATPDLDLKDWPAHRDSRAQGWLVLVAHKTEQTLAMPARQTPEQSAVATRAAAEPDAPTDQVLPIRSTHALEMPHFSLTHKIRLSVPALARLKTDAPNWLKLGWRMQQDVDPALMSAVEGWLIGNAQARDDTAFVALADLQQTRDLPGEPFRFALASCQYPNGLFDRGVAGASLDALAAKAASKLADGTITPIGLALMVGDQIYADATAGLTDPTRRDELYELPHQRAFQLEAMRRVMRRMPVQMLLDDHELFDNWEPLPLTLETEFKRVKDEVKRRDEAHKNGVNSYRLYQRMLKPYLGPATAPQDQHFMAGGHAFFLLDTRTCRRRSAPSNGTGGGHLVSGAQQLALENWLLEHRERVKFIATPSMLLPLRAEGVGRPANACRDDGWAGFPDSLQWVLDFIANNQLRKTVFLSGDEHHSLHAEALLGSGEKQVKVVSVHSSGLYAPYPFANGRPSELAGDDATPIGSLPVSTRSFFAPGGNGFAALQVVGTPAKPVLHIDYCKPGGEFETAARVSLL